MSSVEPVYLSVAVPAYNEEKNILNCLNRIKAFLSHQQYNWEIVVSSDGSQDNTDRLVAEWIAKEKESRVRILRSEKNIGKGATSRRAILDCQGKFILLTDVNLSSPIKEVDKLLAKLESGFQVAIGSLALRGKGTDVQQSLKRTLSGRIFNFFVKRLVISDFMDTQCGFKAFSREAARTLFSKMTLEGFSFDVEILYLAKINSYKTAEVPVMWKQAEGSKVSLVRDSIRMFKDLFYLKKHYNI